MRSLNTDALFSMEVVNLCGGVQMGCPTALELCVGQDGAAVAALCLPCGSGHSGWLPFVRRDVYRIPWRCVECIGEDTVLVRLSQDELNACRQPEPRRR